MRTMLSLLDLSRDRLALLSLVRVLEHANPEKLFAMLERLAMDEVNHYRGMSHVARACVGVNGCFCIVLCSCACMVSLRMG